jgi:8-amino-7-oxononanoate synthase
MHSFEKRLAKRYEVGSNRSLSLFNEAIDFYSNDYLGISKFQISHTNTILTGGSTGSRLLSGNSKAAIECEFFLANYFQSEAALVFNSGYDANIGLFSSIPQKGDTVIYDSLIHASVRDGIRLSYADSYSFRHNDVDDLKQKLKRAKGTVFVAIESLYSMDGDLAPVESIYTICEANNALLIIDEAHAGGVLGDEGKGLSLNLNVFARLVTFGKAYGSHGAVVLSSNKVKDYLINFARSFIYTTALPFESYNRINDVLTNQNELNISRNSLQENIFYFRKMFGEELISDSTSPIQIISCPGIENAKKMAEKLQENGFAVKPILSPTVAEGSERIRICIHSFNSKQEIEQLIELLRS